MWQTFKSSQNQLVSVSQTAIEVGDLRDAETQRKTDIFEIRPEIKMLLDNFLMCLEWNNF